MNKKDAIKYFGTQAAVARALKCDPAYVSRWPKRVPLKSAIRLEQKSKGKLRLDLRAYL